MQHITVDDIIDGMVKITLNAQSLADEAELLLNNKYFARAYTLPHIAREEISKLYILFRIGIEVIAGKEYDNKKLQKRLNSHKSKIEFFSFPIALHRQKDKFVETINERKNNSLYVGWKDSKFQSPSEAISEHISKRTVDLSIYTILKITNVNKIIDSLIYWKEAPKEKFDKAFKDIIFKTNDEILDNISYKRLIKQAKYLEKKRFEEYYKNLEKLKDID